MSVSRYATTRKRLTFQLTPLLDLLLIVIFAQYMEVQQRSEAARSDIAEQQQALNDARDNYLAKAASLQRQHLAIADRWASALDLPRALTRVISQLEADGRTVDAERLNAAAGHIQGQITARGEQLLEFMVQYDEMQKHVTLWQLHLLANGQAELSDGTRQQRVSFGDADEFIQRLLDASKRFDRPKTLVIILLSYGDTQAGFRRIAAQAMPALTERLREDSSRTRWYDYSLLGYRPQPAGDRP
ncbi:MAG: hypothetical protein KDA92_15930 [Planctomycetales bacterium]|nr:hypothetical protein [Planctomycetales bacterium]MCA9166724.1 hypothetical protein [Planctomycetales bacterium]